MASSHTCPHNCALNCHKQDKMIAETIQAFWKKSPPALEAGDEHFNVVSRACGFGWGTSVKVKGDFNEATTERLLKTATAAHTCLNNSAAVANNEAFSTAAVSTSVAAAIIASSLAI